MEREDKIAGENERLLTFARETILNLRMLTAEAERVLQRAEEMFAEANQATDYHNGL